MIERRELVSVQTRSCIRDLMSESTLRRIDNMWQDEGFPPPTEDRDPVGGQRVTLFQGYMDQVDWRSPAHTKRALRVFETALDDVLGSPALPDATEWVSKQRARVRKLLARDECEYTTAGQIIPRRLDAAEVVAAGLLSKITNAEEIHDHLNRISGAIENDDPRLAIGSAKELIESTAKLVLTETGSTVSDKMDVPELVKRAEEALQLHASTQAGPDGSPTVRRILGGSHSVAVSIAELRNTYGTGHGKMQFPVNLSARHARLAVNAARLWCEFMLDTLSDPAAPWKRTASQ